MCLPSFCLESTFLEEADRDDLLRIPAVYGLSASRTIAFSTVVVFLRRHESARQAFVAKDVAFMYCQYSSLVSCLASTYHK